MGTRVTGLVQMATPSISEHPFASELLEDGADFLREDFEHGFWPVWLFGHGYRFSGWRGKREGGLLDAKRLVLQVVGVLVGYLFPILRLLISKFLMRDIRNLTGIPSFKVLFHGPHHIKLGGGKER
jgi:hypothetical protein